MGRKKLVGQVIEAVTIIDAGAEGKGVGRKDDRVIFVPFTSPGDEVDVVITKQRRSYLEGRVQEFRKKSDIRQEPVCEHFGTCGGCRWQHLPYKAQLLYKQKVVVDNFLRIGGLEPEETRQIIPSPATEFYRNKLEYTFSSRRWFELPPVEGEERDARALGFHMPRMFDRILDIRNCHLQAEPSNTIRLAARKLALEMNLDFYDTRNHEGFLRNIIIRTTVSGNVMVVLVVAIDETAVTGTFLDRLVAEVPGITSVWYVVNPKQNDTIYDLTPRHHGGDDHLVEELEGLKFRIGPKSFFQTNARQALSLYRVVRELADLDGTQHVYDLYCGTGTIGLFLADRAAHVTGVEYVGEAVDDARVNAGINGITNATFIAGDLAKMFDRDFIAEHGIADLVVADPPRAGMHPKVIDKLLEMQAPRIIYVSCNPATQARDIQLLSGKYRVELIQPVDMFPHTHHVENVALLRLNS